MKTDLKFIMIVALAITSCNGKGDSVFDTKIVRTFPVEHTVSVNSMNLAEVLDYPTRIFCEENLLILRESQSDYKLITMIDAAERTSHKVLTKGRGPKELVNVWYVTSADSNKNVWAFDVVASDVIQINLTDSTFDIGNKILFDDEAAATYSVDLLNDSIFVCSGRYDGYRVAKVNGKGSVVDRTGVNPSDDHEDFDRFLNEAYQGAVKCKPDGKKYVIACKYCDQMEIFKSDGKAQETIIKGPVFAEPIYKVISVRGVAAMALDREKSIEGYCDVAVTDDYIVGLFSGKQQSEKGSEYASILHVFDWKGKTVAKYVIDQKCLALSIDRATNRIYLLSVSPVPEIYYLDLIVK